MSYSARYNLDNPEKVSYSKNVYILSNESLPKYCKLIDDSWYSKNGNKRGNKTRSYEIKGSIRLAKGVATYVRLIRTDKLDKYLSLVDNGTKGTLNLKSLYKRVLKVIAIYDRTIAVELTDSTAIIIPIKSIKEVIHKDLV